MLQSAVSELNPGRPTSTGNTRTSASVGWSRASRHERGYGAAWDAIRKVILARDRGTCQTCLRLGHARVGNIVDHIIPKAEGGTDHPANLEVICREHHTDKTQRESARARGQTHER